MKFRDFNQKRKEGNMITREMNILEAVQKYPVIVNVFRKYGLG